MTVVAALGSAVVLGAAGCSSGSSSSEVTATATVTETASASASPSASGSKSADYVPITEPPSGAKELEHTDSADYHYSRYSIDGQQPAQIVSYYTNAWQNDGYTIDSSGGGGGGWGQYGGSGAGATGSKSGSFVAVQAGGQSGATTYFEVCEGTNQQVVDQCGSDNDNDNDND